MRKLPVKEKVHFVHESIRNNPSKTKVCVIGAGGSGSFLINKLAMMNQALMSLGKPGLMVYVYDADTVEIPNLHRTSFMDGDVGKNKAVVAVERLNRVYGTAWIGIPEMFRLDQKDNESTLMITCVDSIKSRKECYNLFNLGYAHYWIDLGNGTDYAQTILGTLQPIKQPISKKYECVEELKHFNKMFGWPEDNPNVPSCSFAEAISKQSLWINQRVALSAAELIWDMFTSDYLTCHAEFINKDECKKLRI